MLLWMEHLWWNIFNHNNYPYLHKVIGNDIPYSSLGFWDWRKSEIWDRAYDTKHVTQNPNTGQYTIKKNPCGLSGIGCLIKDGYVKEGYEYQYLRVNMFGHSIMDKGKWSLPRDFGIWRII